MMLTEEQLAAYERRVAELSQDCGERTKLYCADVGALVQAYRELFEQLRELELGEDL